MRALPPAETGNPLPYLIQGEEFLRPSVRAMQADDFDNPALPLVEAAEASWSRPATPGGKSCEDCHGGGDRNLLKRAAAAYPKYAPDLKEVITLQTRINNCRKIHLGEPAIAEGDFENDRHDGLSALARARGAVGRRYYRAECGGLRAGAQVVSNETGALSDFLRAMP